MHFFSPPCVTCPAHLFRIFVHTEHEALHHAVFSIFCHFLPLSPKYRILLITLFFNMLSLCTLLNVRDQVSHPRKTTQWDCACLFIELVPNPVTKHESKREVSHKQCNSVHVLKNHACIKVINSFFFSFR